MIINNENRTLKINHEATHSLSQMGMKVMNRYITVPLFSLGLAIILLFVSMPFSGATTSYWNGTRCAEGTEYGFPIPFFYNMNRSSAIPPQTHSTSVCTSNANISPVKMSWSNALDDYLFWFAVSLPIVFGLSHVAGAGKSKQTQEDETPKLEREPTVAPIG